MIGSLWIAQVALFVGGWLGPWRDAPARGTNGRMPQPVRMLLSVSLAGAAFLIWRSSAPATAAYSQWVLAGMSASVVGDFIMAKLLPLPNRLIGGMVAFGAAHALYITAYVQTIHLAGAAVVSSGLCVGLVVYGLGTLGGWWLLIRNPQKDTLVNAGALVYGVWISVMAAFAFALAVALGGAWWLTAVGGLLFVVSDSLIGITDIRGVRLVNANDWIWATYVAGQMGIIYAGWVRSLAGG
jgi:hypothetical protein